MIKTEGNFLYQTNKNGYVGRVIMEIIESENDKIDVTNVTGWDNEQVYSEWIKGAETGAEYALRKITDKNYLIRIKKILGTDCDTNPTIIRNCNHFRNMESLTY